MANKITCPHCGETIDLFPKRIRIRGKYQIVEFKKFLEPPQYAKSSMTNEYLQPSRIPVYFVSEDK